MLDFKNFRNCLSALFLGAAIFNHSALADDAFLDPDKAVRLGGEEDIAKIVDSDVKFGEGPVWRKAQGEVLFSDIPRNTIYSWNKKTGAKTVFMRPAGFTGAQSEIVKNLALGSNGLALTPEGGLAICQQGNRRIAVLDESIFSVRVLADSYNGKVFNNPNDLVFLKNGDFFFTDPCFWIRHRAPAENELDFSGIFKVSAKGEVLLIDTLPQPNGIGFSPDEKLMYISQSGSGEQDPCWFVYQLNESKTAVVSKRVFCNLAKWKGRKMRGTPDGFAVGADGFIYATGTGGIHIFSPDLKHLGYVETSVQVANCCIVDADDGLFLFAVGTKNAYLIDLNAVRERIEKNKSAAK